VKQAFKLIAAAGGGIAAAVGALLGFRWARAGFHAARFGVRLATLTAYRRCPSCFSVRRREARVCAACGAALRP
jgi:hypothetical protein